MGCSRGEHELFGLEAFFEGYHDQVGLVWISFDGFVFADALGYVSISILFVE